MKIIKWIFKLILSFILTILAIIGIKYLIVDGGYNIIKE